MIGVLEQQVGNSTPKEFQLAGPAAIVLGRDRSCAIRIADSKLSRRHCVFEFSDGCWSVRDLGSMNGTRVNDARITEVRLQDGDIVMAGNVRFVFRSKPTDVPHPAIRTTVDFVSPIGAVPREAQPSDMPQEPRLQSGSNTPAMPARSHRDLLAGRYEMLELIHHGSTGAFWKALDVKSDRAVCVKLLSKRVTSNEAELRRFVRGVQTAARLQHPNVVQLYRAGQSQSRKQWWLAMEFVDGPSLRQVLRDYGIANMLAPGKVLAIARDITSALEVAYEKQVLHRNIRPENILVTKSGATKLGDFALTRGVVLTTLQRITDAHTIVGDLAYLAPERTDPDGMVDCRADIYALGACLYTLLAGRPPFTGRGTVELIERIRYEEVQAPSRYNLSVPGPLEGVVMKCLAKSPTQRYQSPKALRAELCRVSQFRPFTR